MVAPMTGIYANPEILTGPQRVSPPPDFMTNDRPRGLYEGAWPE